MKNQLIIAGPCALESREQLKVCVRELNSLGIKHIRASLWKPRTHPGWEGMGILSLLTLLEETLPYGIVPATEVLTPEQASLIVEGLRSYDHRAPMLVWIGARNQNHITQRCIAEILASGGEGIHLMFKNQMWEDERHWLGIFAHLIEAGFPSERLLVCHRGFSPGRLPNPYGYRNLPNFEMAKRVKEKTGLSMLIDPSHIGGTQANVFRILEEAKTYPFDGYLIEVHLDPENAKTDGKQQLTFVQLKQVIQMRAAAENDKQMR
ncbi:MAG: hypothetical protein WB791_04805 [Waddliaceae bacterium]